MITYSNVIDTDANFVLFADIRVSACNQAKRYIMKYVSKNTSIITLKKLSKPSLEKELAVLTG